MKTAQFVLCGQETRLFLAYCVFRSGLLDRYREKNRIFFKGGATVSCLTKLFCNTPMRLAGRVTKYGLRGAKKLSPAAHALVYEQGTVTNVDSDVPGAIRSFGPEDLFVTGANAIDGTGHAAMLLGRNGGGVYGECLPYLYTTGVQVIVLASALKLIPGDLEELYKKVSLKNCDCFYGMPCSLAPVHGRIITEKEAAELYAEVQAVIFAAGGHSGAEGSLALQVSGSDREVDRLLELVAEIKDIPETLLCDPVSEVPNHVVKGPGKRNTGDRRTTKKQMAEKKLSATEE